ncbi:MAG: hypothetical protein H6779_04835 [Candidatus Nomurabacteria bacterium]|nr:hypothetical protein [Candidatus Nomurabacteria bacterium]USN87696.1 MAG: hypothetical protein H6779_04835 [Candidatus Nomurabacteria bacterium]
MSHEHKILVKYLSIALLLVVIAYLSGTQVINSAVSIFDLYLILSLLITGIRRDLQNKRYYYFLSVYLLLLVVLIKLGVISLLGDYTAGLLIAPHLWFLAKHRQTVSPQIARSLYFVISPIMILLLLKLLSSIGIFSIYAISPLNIIVRLI